MPAFTNPGAVRSMLSLKTAAFRHQGLARGTALSSRVLGRGTIMTAPCKAALRAKHEDIVPGRR